MNLYTALSRWEQGLTMLKESLPPRIHQPHAASCPNMHLRAKYAFQHARQICILWKMSILTCAANMLNLKMRKICI